MTAIIVMLSLLVLPYVITRVRAVRWRSRGPAAARLGLALMFVFTAVGHFVETDAMVRMIPPVVPWRVEIVYASGIFEFALAAALLHPSTSRAASIVSIVFLASALPLNIYAAMNAVPMGGHGMGPIYLAARVPVQVFIACWAYYFGVQRSRSTSPSAGAAAAREDQRAAL